MTYRGLYPILDCDALEQRSLEPLPLAETWLTLRPRWLQVRAKRQGARQVLRLLEQLAARCEAAGTQLVVNDRADLALLAGAPYVHVGQTDVPLELLRRRFGALRVGVSTHDLGQLEAALAERPDYVAFGPVFATQSKQGADPVVGLTGLRAASGAAHAAGIPLVAIGGIGLENAERIAALGAVGAVIGALLPESPTAPRLLERARALHRALGGEG